MRKLIYLCSLLCIFNTIKAQSVSTEDAGMWATVTIQKSLTKRMSLTLDEELRMRENYQRINLFYSNLGLSYKFKKNIKGEFSYRAIQKVALDQTVSYRHRLQFDLTLKTKINFFTVSGRVRYQTEVQEFYSSRKGKIPENFLRFKIEIKAETGKLYSPYISSELRYQINSPRGKLPDYNMGFHRIRNIAGIEFKLTKRKTLNLYYVIQREFDIVRPENIYITGIQYIYEF